MTGMTTTIIDAEGQVWDGSSSLLRSKLRCPPAEPELADFAVKSMGFVALRRYGARSVESAFDRASSNQLLC